MSTLSPVAARFADDWGMTPADVAKLIDWADRAKDANEHAANGDPHFNSPDKRDKACNAREWEMLCDALDNRMITLVEPYGFTAVVYTGLRPCLKRGEQFVEIPS